MTGISGASQTLCVTGLPLGREDLQGGLFVQDCLEIRFHGTHAQLLLLPEAAAAVFKRVWKATHGSTHTFDSSIQEAKANGSP